MAEVKGLISRLYVDFGDKFKVNDVDGIECQEIMIKDI